ncbi:MAG: hypothetical protein J1F05_08145 [Muribaculaceae bacterium]|nr:hypothetical protein [Muribaculaceae bacterium]
MKHFIYSLLIGFAVMSCSEGGAAGDPEEIEPPEVVEEEVVEFTESDNVIAGQMKSFNVEFFKAVNKVAKEDENVLVSPLSASILLSMLANATNQETSAEILDVLGCKDLNALNVLSHKYLTLLPEIDGTTTMCFANSVWYQKGYSLNTTFQKVLADYFDAETFSRQLQTNDPVVIKEVNDWVSDKTEGLIPSIIKDLPETSLAIFINAQYFKGAWANPFDADETEKKEFYGVDDTTTVDMMYKSGMQHYCETDLYKGVMMEFGNGAFEAVMILPNEGVSFDEVLASDELYSINSHRYLDLDIEYYLPKFKLEPDEIDITKNLAEMGIESIYKWQYKYLFSAPVLSMGISIRQKATIEFTEKGAEGSTVTWTPPIWLGSEAPEPVVVNFNRPFMFFINETNTGAMLFAGKVVKL